MCVYHRRLKALQQGTPMSMQEGARVSAAVLIIGNEILSGRTQDTNLNHLALTLNEYGIQILEARVVPDIEAEIIAAVNALRHKYDYVFTTGGIGPTHDDITADCIAKAFGVALEINEEIAEILRRRVVPPDVQAIRMRMARVPKGGDAFASGLIRNPTGPHGFYIGNVYVMAGIPSVMQGMLASLKGQLKRGVSIDSQSVTVYLPESQIAKAFGELQTQYPDIDMGSYPFQKADRYGTTLVLRGPAGDRLNAARAGVEAMVRAAGSEPLPLP
jgi:molybdenum cofactor synthesis domain-containing protein